MMPTVEKKKPWATVIVDSDYDKTGNGLGYNNGYLTELVATQACDQSNAVAEKMDLTMRYKVIENKTTDKEEVSK